MTDNLQNWVGRQQTINDEMNPWAARALHMTLDRTNPLPETGSPLPPAWHWVYFNEATPLRDAGRDGHPVKGTFLPPSPLPRRMWAGGRFNITRPLILGVAAQRTSTILSITEKSGRSGPLCFVTVVHRFTQQDEHCFTEEHDIVYRNDPVPGKEVLSSPQADENCEWQRAITPTPTLLFRYSALTFNGHRIHYDRDYTKDIEGYSGLVVHGPLIATWMFELLRDHVPSSPISISYQAKTPLFDHEQLVIKGRRVGDVAELWACGPDSRLVMTASAKLIK